MVHMNIFGPQSGSSQDSLLVESLGKDSIVVLSLGVSIQNGLLSDSTADVDFLKHKVLGLSHLK